MKGLKKTISLFLSSLLIINFTWVGNLNVFAQNSFKESNPKVLSIGQGEDEIQVVQLGIDLF